MRSKNWLLNNRARDSAPASAPQTAQKSASKKALSRSFLWLAAGTILSACSNDAIRFEEALTTGSIGNTSNQNAIIYKQNGSNRLVGTALKDQPYPGDIDGNVTGSIHRTRSGVSVVRRNVSGNAPAVSRSNLPKLSAPKVNAPAIPAPRIAKTPTYAAPTYAAPSYSAPKVSAPAVRYKAPVPRSTAPGIAVLPPRGGVSTDSTITGSVQAPNSATPAVAPIARSFPANNAPTTTQQASNRPSAGSGWTKAGGTWVTVGQGETLYNLSRRYGVPVSAISKANGISDPSKVSSGTKILIPTYSFSSSAPISAPDSNPGTKVARATRGFQGQVLNGRVAVPTARSRDVAAAQGSVPAPLPVPPVGGTNVNTGSYTVKSGDTLYGISRSTGASVQAIQSANGMTNTTVRIGQRLRIPSGGQTVASTDTIVTGSVPKTRVEKQRPTVQSPAPKVTYRAPKPKSNKNVASVAPAAFQWPLKGRVLARFGEKMAGNTNDGIDIAAPVGSSVRAVRSGKVIYAGSELEDFGQLILLSHSDGWVSAYAHASKTLVKRGDTVQTGQVIAKSGQTGNAASPRLHFELRKNSSPVNPLNHLK
ncbi:MAG: peptidoglycan DD-metalloendopeptidase family protein [Pseudomonadota bacterium]